MKITIIFTGKSLKGGGGAERRFIRLLDYLNDTRIMLITNKEVASDIIQNKIIKNDKLVIYPKRRMSLIEFNLWLINTVKIIQPNVIHLVLIQKSLIPFYLWLNVFERRTTVVSSMVWTRFLMPRSVRFIDVLLGNLIWRRSSLIDSLYPSSLKSRWLQPFLKKIRITPCSFTDYDLFMPSARKENIVCFVGRLIKEKNPLLFCEAIRYLKCIRPDIVKSWKFIILGKGKLEHKIKEFVRNNSLEGIIELKSVFNTHEYLKKSKIYVTLQEPTNYPSQSLIEAMATENAIIATDDEDTRLIIDSKCGILIQRRVEDIVDALIKLMKDDEIIEKFGKEARIKVMREHNLDRFAKYIVNFWCGNV